LISSALKRRTSCEEKLGEVDCVLLFWNDAKASRSTTDVENEKSNNPGMILVGIRVTDKKHLRPVREKPRIIMPVPHLSKKSYRPEIKIGLT
jgi:hypothetical protein